MFITQKKLYQARIEKFIQRLKTLFYEQSIDLDIVYCKFDPHVNFNDCLTGNYKTIEKHKPWGKDWERAWFHVTGSVPNEWQGQNVITRINLGGESLVFDKNGMPVSGLSVHTLWPTEEFWRDRIQITEKSEGNEIIDFWIESSAGQIFGLFPLRQKSDDIPKSGPLYNAAIQYAELAIFRKDIWDLYLDCLVLNDLMLSWPENSIKHKRILRTLGLAIDQFTGNTQTTKQAREILKKELSKTSSASDLQLTAIGHAHIDTGWLWPVDESIRKCARTFSSQLDLIEKYPDYIFGASQAQHYEFTKQHYPALYQKIKEKVKQGRWEIQGGMWVEADCNIISGESMVRQFLLGKKFFQDEFDVDVDNLWLPDVFGYSAALPQIMHKCGIKFFLTQKMAWSQFNKFPHHTFKWRGIDGTEIIAHFPPGASYSIDLRPSLLVQARDKFEESDRLDEFLTLFGIGDGGSGPTEEMIETGIRQQDLEGTPRVTFGTARDFFHRLEKQSDQIPSWNGELYLEYHRGTLTTQAIIKKLNRHLELKLRQVEILYTLLPMKQYPGEELEKLWKVLLLNQFHDIIPGTSVSLVYETTIREYQQVLDSANQLENNAGNLLAQDNRSKLTLINTLSVSYTRPVKLPESWAGYELTDDKGNIIPVQIENGIPVISLSMDAMQACTINRTQKSIHLAEKKQQKDFILENDLIRYEFDERGCISRIFDKEIHREVLAENGLGNIFSLYEDRPVDWDAWDIDIYYENQMLAPPVLINREWIISGSVRAGFNQTLSVGNSKISQDIFLDQKSKQLDFNTTVQWQEDHKMLRVSFNVDIFADTASFEIQFGHVRRNTHRNTSWDMAKFEVAAHRYADLSDSQYGVALLNDCKYGYKIHKNTIDLNLLRSPAMPDPNADRGLHEFTYSLLPHKNDLIHSDVIPAAFQLNQPPLQFARKDGQKIKIPFALDSQQVILDTIKKAEHEDAWILRFYEPRGMRVNTRLFITYNNPVISETDLLENDIDEIKIKHMDTDVQSAETASYATNRQTYIELVFKPFEIKTIKIKPGNEMIHP